jgi:hypothetical protein
LCHLVARGIRRAPIGERRLVINMSKRDELERALKHLVDNLKPFPEQLEQVFLLASIDMILNVLAPEADTPDAVPKSWEEERAELLKENERLRVEQLRTHQSRTAHLAEVSSGACAIQVDVPSGYWSHMDFSAVVPQGSPQCLSRKIVLSFPEDCAGKKITVEVTK